MQQTIAFVLAVSHGRKASQSSRRRSALTRCGTTGVLPASSASRCLLFTIHCLLFTDKMHHASIRTADIHQAIAFYEQLGFSVKERFTTGYTLACWMTGLGGRIELIQIPEPKPAADAFDDEHYVGYYHLSFDLTDSTADLSDWLQELQQKIDALRADNPDKLAPLKVLLKPEQQMIGDRIYEVAFIADTDGLPLEFIRVLKAE